MKQYEKATLLDNSTVWLIVFYALNPNTGKLQRVRKTYDINRIADKKERRALAHEIMCGINDALASGWNPLDPNQVPPKESKFAAPRTLATAFKKAYQVKIIGNKDTSIDSYRSISNIFQSWLKGIDTLAPQDFTAAHFQEYLSERFAAGKGMRNLNAHINLIKAVFNKMRRPLGLITDNPLEGFELYAVEDSNRFEPFTIEELRRVATHLKAVDSRFFCFTNFIYYAYIRPGHLNTLQRSQIDFENNIIHVRGSTTKNKKNSAKQLLQPLKNSLMALGIDKLPGHYYIFSNDFKPSPTPLVSLYTRAAERWIEYVVTALDIDKRMYALKHTSGQLYLTENDAVDASWLQRQMEHGSLAETEAYISARKSKKLDESKTNMHHYEGEDPAE